MKFNNINMVGKMQIQRINVSDMSNYAKLEARFVFNEYDNRLWYCDSDVQEPGHWFQLANDGDCNITLIDGGIYSLITIDGGNIWANPDEDDIDGGPAEWLGPDEYNVDGSNF